MRIFPIFIWKGTNKIDVSYWVRQVSRSKNKNCHPVVFLCMRHKAPSIRIRFSILDLSYENVELRQWKSTTLRYDKNEDAFQIHKSVLTEKHRDAWTGPVLNTKAQILDTGHRPSFSSIGPQWLYLLRIW